MTRLPARVRAASELDLSLAERVLASGDWEAKDDLAVHPACPPSAQLMLLTDPAAGVTDNDRSLPLARNPGLCPQAQELLARSSRTSVLCALAVNAALLPNVQRALLTQAPQAATSLALNPSLALDVQADLFELPHVRRVILQNPSLGPALLDRAVRDLLKHDDDCPCWYLARHPGLTPAQQVLLSTHAPDALALPLLARTDVLPEVRAQHVRTGLRDLEDLSTADRAALAAVLSEGDVRDLLEQQDPLADLLLASAPALPPSVQDELLRRAQLDEVLFGAIALLQDLPEALQHELVDASGPADEFSSLRAYLAGNPFLAPSVAERLLEFSEERAALLCNAAVPLDVMRRAVDPDDVNHAALLAGNEAFRVMPDDLVSTALEAAPAELFTILEECDLELVDALVESWSGTVAELRATVLTLAPDRHCPLP